MILKAIGMQKSKETRVITYTCRYSIGFLVTFGLLLPNPFSTNQINSVNQKHTPTSIGDFEQDTIL